MHPETTSPVPPHCDNTKQIAEEMGYNVQQMIKVLITIHVESIYMYDPSLRYQLPVVSFLPVHDHHDVDHSVSNPSSDGGGNAGIVGIDVGQ